MPEGHRRLTVRNCSPRAAAEPERPARGVTSLIQIRLIDAIEDTFGIDVDFDGGLSFLDSLDSLADYLGRHGVSGAQP